MANVFKQEPFYDKVWITKEGVHSKNLFRSTSISYKDIKTQHYIIEADDNDPASLHFRLYIRDNSNHQIVLHLVDLKIDYHTVADILIPIIENRRRGVYCAKDDTNLINLHYRLKALRKNSSLESSISGLGFMHLFVVATLATSTGSIIPRIAWSNNFTKSYLIGAIGSVGIPLLISMISLIFIMYKSKEATKYLDEESTLGIKIIVSFACMVQICFVWALAFVGLEPINDYQKSETSVHLTQIETLASDLWQAHNEDYNYAEIYITDVIVRDGQPNIISTVDIYGIDRNFYIPRNAAIKLIPLEDETLTETLLNTTELVTLEYTLNHRIINSVISKN
ncbi:MAG: hypothetical protein ATN36_06190 [Epulopiscium sp. Nele67-Bin005]|nr:MAG: hypothetical protein ATN36_06190 [Epulopiscium sp. Nele67-Bin005]